MEGGAHEGLRAQKTARATGARPGALEEPESQGGAVADEYGAVAGRAATGRRGRRSRGLLLLTALEAEGGEEEEDRKKELEEAEEAKVRADEMQSLLAVPRALRTPAQLRRFEELCALTEASTASLQRRRKRKKSRKRKTPKTSSCGLDHRRQRQWCFHGWLRCISRCVPSFVGRTKLLCIMAGMDQIDSFQCVRRRLRLWHMQSWSGIAPRAVFLPWFCRRRCSTSWRV